MPAVGLRLFFGSIVSFMLFLIMVPASTADDVCPNGVLAAGSGADIVINKACLADGNVPSGQYSYGNINIIVNGSLTFADAKIDFWSRFTSMVRTKARTAPVSHASAIPKDNVGSPM